VCKKEHNLFLKNCLHWKQKPEDIYIGRSHMGILVRSVPYVLYDEAEVLVAGLIYQCREQTWILPGA